MGLISTALDLIPLPTDSWPAKVKKVYKFGKTAYDVTTVADKYLDVSGKTGKGIYKLVGPASKGFINKVDKASEFYHKYNTEAKLVKGAGRLIQEGYSKIVKSISGKTPVQNPAGSKMQPKSLPAHSTAFPKTTPAPAKGLTLNLPQVPSYHLRQPKLGKSLHLKSYKAPLNLGSYQAKVNLRALANSKLFTIKTQAGGSSFNPAKSKAFTIKTQTSASKFNPAKSKAFTIKTKSSFMPKLNTPKLKPPSMNTKPAYKLPLANKPVFKSALPNRSARPSSISKSPVRSSFKR